MWIFSISVMSIPKAKYIHGMIHFRCTTNQISKSDKLSCTEKTALGSDKQDIKYDVSRSLIIYTIEVYHLFSLVTHFPISEDLNEPYKQFCLLDAFRL